MSEKTNYLTAKVVIEVTNHGWEKKFLLPNGEQAKIESVPDDLLMHVDDLDETLTDIELELGDWTHQWSLDNQNGATKVDNRKGQSLCYKSNNECKHNCFGQCKESM